MEKIVVDSSIVFSALISPGGKAFRVLMESTCEQFFCPNFFVREIFKHKEHLLHKTHAPEDKVFDYLHGLLQKLHFVNEELISIENFFEGYYLCKGIDENDAAFIALTIELDARFWTKDDKLKEGLRRKGFDRFFEP